MPRFTTGIKKSMQPTISAPFAEANFSSSNREKTTMEFFLVSSFGYIVGL